MRYLLQLSILAAVAMPLPSCANEVSEEAEVSYAQSIAARVAPGIQGREAPGRPGPARTALGVQGPVEEAMAAVAGDTIAPSAPLASVSALGATLAATAEPSLDANLVEAHGGLLLWGDNAEGQRTTWWVADGGSALVVRDWQGLRIAVEGEVWDWHESEYDLPLGLDCPMIEEAHIGKGIQVDLVSNDPAYSHTPTRTLLEPDESGAFESAGWQESVRPLGSLGPYLFVRTDVNSYYCGAHGNSVSRFEVFDIRNGEPVLLADFGALDIDQMEQEAFETLLSDDKALFEPDLALTLFHPTFSPRGRARIAYQWSGSTCYACSDGNWSSYTVSTHLTRDSLPPVLEPFTTFSSALVRRFIASAPGVTIRGVSEVSEATLG